MQLVPIETIALRDDLGGRWVRTAPGEVGDPAGEERWDHAWDD
jgi:hypothetical protein